MSLLQWCDEGPATVPVEATVEDAIRTMIDKAVGAVAVIDQQGLVAGMFTERDVLAKLALSRRDPKSTPLRELMSPIVDESGKLLGVCSIRNILQARIDNLLAELDGQPAEV